MKSYRTVHSFPRMYLYENVGSSSYYVRGLGGGVPESYIPFLRDPPLRGDIPTTIKRGLEE